MNKWKQILTPFFLLFTAGLLDGFIASHFSSSLDTEFGLIVPRFVFLVLVILSFHYEQNFMYINAVIMGFIMDAYYIGFLGIYLAAFVLIVMIATTIKPVLNPNVLSYTMVSILGLTASELLIYSMMRILGITSMSFQVFIVSRLSATLVFNALIMLVFSYFIHHIMIKLLDDPEIR